MIINPELLTSLIVGVLVGGASAYLGSVMVLKRLALVGDALSHVALPGIGIALTIGVNPFLGAFTALAVGILTIWGIERKAPIPTEAVVGLIFTVSLAVGILVTPEPELLEALFGDISKVSPLDAAIAAVLSVVVAVAMRLTQKDLVLGLISPDFAKAQGVKVAWLNLMFLALVAVVVALGVKVVGTLLMGALVVIPAAASKNMTRSFGAYSIFSLILGAVTAVAGIVLAAVFSLPPGPMVVLAGAALFLFSLAFRAK